MKTFFQLGYASGYDISIRTECVGEYTVPNLRPVSGSRSGARFINLHDLCNRNLVKQVSCLKLPKTA